MTKNVSLDFALGLHQCPSGEDHLWLFTHIGHEHKQCSLKRSVKMHSMPAFNVAGSRRFFLNFFCISIIHPKKNLIKMW